MTENTQPEAPVYRPSRLPAISLVAGLLSVWPYLVWLIAIAVSQGQQLPLLIKNLLGAILLFIVPCNGLLFGLIGLGMGIVSLRKKVAWMAIAGVLLSALGIVGNIWYFTLL
jgi:hypothetical protein